MAIKRINPNATFDIVSVYDEALKHETNEEIEALKQAGGQTRFEKYLESFDLGELQFLEGEKPTLFRVRCLRAIEKAELDQKYQVIDVVNKRIEYKNRQEMMLDIFSKACLGIVAEDGSVEKISVDEIEYKVASDVGAGISILGSVNKNLKKG
jgi:hypothetical protein